MHEGYTNPVVATVTIRTKEDTIPISTILTLVAPRIISFPPQLRRRTERTGSGNRADSNLVRHVVLALILDQLGVGSRSDERPRTITCSRGRKSEFDSPQSRTFASFS